MFEEAKRSITSALLSKPHIICKGDMYWDLVLTAAKPCLQDPQPELTDEQWETLYDYVGGNLAWSRAEVNRILNRQPVPAASAEPTFTVEQIRKAAKNAERSNAAVEIIYYLQNPKPMTPEERVTVRWRESCNDFGIFKDGQLFDSNRRKDCADWIAEGLRNALKEGK